MTEYVYRVVNKAGYPLKTRQSSSHEAFYAQRYTARMVATRANKTPDRWGQPGSSAGQPYRVQRSKLEWEETE